MQKYKMSEKQLKTLLDACKPTMCIKIGNYTPPTPQENANRAWAVLGKELGFKPMTVKPIQGGSQRQFMAEPVEDENNTGALHTTASADA